MDFTDKSVSIRLNALISFPGYGNLPESLNSLSLKKHYCSCLGTYD